MRLFACVLSIALALSACAGGSGVPAPEAGWVFDGPDDVPPQVMPAVEALAWRYDDYEGKQVTDIWIAAKALTDAERAKLKPLRNGQSYSEDTGPEALGLHGLLIRVDDTGNNSDQMINLCMPNGEALYCSGGSGLGMALIRNFDSASVAGEFYTRGPGGKLYSAAFEAPIKNESDTPMPANVQWSVEGGAAGKAWLESNSAALSGNLEVLRQYALPERAADYGDPAVLKFVQRIALQQPQILSARIAGDEAMLWVRDTVMKNEVVPGVQRIHLQQVEGRWRVARVQTN